MSVPGCQIRCPRCWERPSENMWYCDVCGKPFNTFITKGMCPTCGEQHEKTQCKLCKQWSRIILWYHYIRCPKCLRPPSDQDQWQCDECGHIWNAFDTRGRCPDCKHQNKNTECLSCSAKSPHLDWYEGH